MQNYCKGSPMHMEYVIFHKSPEDAMKSEVNCYPPKPSNDPCVKAMDNHKCCHSHAKGQDHYRPIFALVRNWYMACQAKPS